MYLLYKHIRKTNPLDVKHKDLIAISIDKATCIEYAQNLFEIEETEFERESNNSSVFWCWHCYTRTKKGNKKYHFVIKKIADDKFLF